MKDLFAQRKLALLSLISVLLWNLPGVCASLRISPGEVSLNERTFQQFTVSVSGLSNSQVIWKISSGVGQITPQGLYIAPQAVSAQTSVEITATSSVNSSITGAATVTLSPYGLVSHERVFPPDAGMIDVKSFGAKGNGIADDTAAIQKAIASNIHGSPGPRILYFPSGTYLVKQPLNWKDLTGKWQAGLTLQGENSQTTVIRLSDNNPMYQNTSLPTPVVDTASVGSAQGKGGGNEAFDNYLFDMTIDVGVGNPAAVALDFMGNNYCGVRNLNLLSSDPQGTGSIGLNLSRYAPGPCLMKNLSITGFDYGIRAKVPEYSVTFENLTLSHQRLCGILNLFNVLNIRNLVSTNTVPAVYNSGQWGMIDIVGGALLGGASTNPAMINGGVLYARNVNTEGYKSALRNQPGLGRSLSEYVSGRVLTLFDGPKTSLNLPIQETPEFEERSLSQWKSVVALGADPTGHADSSDSIQAAIDSGATTVYFPTGKYLVTKTIFVRGDVRMIQGFDSLVVASGAAFERASSPSPLFQIDEGSADVTLDHLRLTHVLAASSAGLVYVLQKSSRPLILRNSGYVAKDILAAYQNTATGTGTLFVEDVTAIPWNILFPQDVFARQIDPEGDITKITNRGGTLWIMGLKTEKTGTNIDTRNHGLTELIGALIYPVKPVPVDIPAFTITNSQASFSYVTSDYRKPNPSGPDGDFKVQVQETQSGVSRTLPSTDVKPRGLGVKMPLYTSE